MRFEEVERRAGGAALLPARLALGATMAYHGATKLKPGGFSQHAEMFQQLGFRRSKPVVAALGLTELFAGASSILGLGTRAAALAVLGTQAGAIAKVHGPKGFASTKGGFEFNLALMGIALALLFAGPGDLSANRLLRERVRHRRFGRTARRRVRALRYLQ